MTGPATAQWAAYGGDPVPADPEAIATVARVFGTIAQAGDDSYRRLRGLETQAGDDIWAGNAADQFRDRLKDTPGQIQKMTTSYNTAAQALAAYVRAVVDLQNQRDALLPQVIAAYQQASTIGTSLLNQDKAAAASSSSSSSPVTLTSAQEAQVSAANSNKAQLDNQVESLRTGLQKAAAAAVSSLKDAHNQGIKNESWWDHVLGDVSDLAGDVLKVLAVVAVVIVIAVVVLAILANPEVWAFLAAGAEAIGGALAAAGSAALEGLAALGEAFGGMLPELAADGADAAAGGADAAAGGADAAAGGADAAAGGADAAAGGAGEAGEAEVPKLVKSLSELFVQAGKNAAYGAFGVSSLKTGVDALDPENRNPNTLINDGVGDLFATLGMAGPLAEDGSGVAKSVAGAVARPIVKIGDEIQVVASDVPGLADTVAKMLTGKSLTDRTSDAVAPDKTDWGTPAALPTRVRLNLPAGV